GSLFYTVKYLYWRLLMYSESKTSSITDECRACLYVRNQKHQALSTYTAPCKCHYSLNTPSWRGFGRCAIHGALVTSPARYSLIIGMLCQSSKHISQKSLSDQHLLL